MVEVTRDLLRGRAEHNEKMLSNLEECSLHQQNLNQPKKLKQIQPLLLNQLQFKSMNHLKKKKLQQK